MPAETLNCPMCGAAAASDATRCEHCGARLATVACPSCFGMIFEGSKFCSHCGVRADRSEAGDSHEQCPRCKVEMQSVLIGKTHLEECTHCEGIWADAASLQQICADREQQAAVIGMASTLPAHMVNIEDQVRYIPCPVCKNLMNRVNFASCSGVIVDVCTQHGTWFDKDELRRIVEFIRAGGIDKMRAREIEDLKQRERLKNSGLSNDWPAPVDTLTNMAGRDIAISVAAAGIRALLNL